MKLSILICTIEQRKVQFAKLFNKLSKQVTPDVEILYICDNKEMTIGGKRQKLLEMAKGDYVTFIDDDDDIPLFYVKKILEAIDQGPDAISFQISCDISGKKETANSSMHYDDWHERVDGFDHVRTIYHKNPVRREFALEIGYNTSMRFGEDYEYSKRLKLSGLLKTEVHIPLNMYFYRYKFEPNKYGDGK